MTNYILYRTKVAIVLAHQIFSTNRYISCRIYQFITVQMNGKAFIMQHQLVNSWRYRPPPPPPPPPPNTGVPVDFRIIQESHSNKLKPCRQWIETISITPNDIYNFREGTHISINQVTFLRPGDAYVDHLKPSFSWRHAMFSLIHWWKQYGKVYNHRPFSTTLSTIRI